MTVGVRYFLEWYKELTILPTYFVMALICTFHLKSGVSFRPSKHLRWRTSLFHSSGLVQVYLVVMNCYKFSFWMCWMIPASLFPHWMWELGQWRGLLPGTCHQDIWRCIHTLWSWFLWKVHMNGWATPFQMMENGAEITLLYAQLDR